MSGRFELLGFEKWRPQPARDRETGERVLLSTQRNASFLGKASLRTMAERVRELNDPRCAEIVCLDPLAVKAPPEQAPTGTLQEWARATVECLDISTRLRREGIIVTAGHGFGWAERREGTLMPVLFAPTFAPTFGARVPVQRNVSWISDVQAWLSHQLPTAGVFDRAGKKLRKALKKNEADHGRAVDSLLEALKPHLDGVDTSRIADAAREVPIPTSARVNFDLAIELGEAAHAEMVADGRQEWDTPLVCWPLAGAYHHRGCVAWERGDRDAAVRDVDRAIELDPHPRYLTTRALFGEALEDPKAASFHDGAILSFLAPDPKRVWGQEPPEIRQRDECRSALSRAAFRHRHGDTAGAIEDLRFVKSRWAQLAGPLGARVDAFLARLTS